MNSKLNMILREKHGLVYNVESSFTSYTDTGLTSIYFGTDHKHLNKALELVHKTLDQLCNFKLTTTQLANAKKQLIGQLGVSGDNKESLFLGLGKSFLHHNRYDSLPEVFDKIDKIKAEDILNTANEIYAREHLSSLIYL
jgi:predicted Zn-dependent peptidase